MNSSWMSLLLSQKHLLKERFSLSFRFFFLVFSLFALFLGPPSFILSPSVAVPEDVVRRVSSYRNQSDDCDGREEMGDTLKKLRIPQLKVLCKKHGLTVGGNKEELITKLLEVGPAQKKSRKKKESAADDLEDGTSTTKKPKRMVSKTVDKMLAKYNLDCSNNCLKAGIQRGFVVLDEADPRLTVVASGSCEECGSSVSATVGDLLDQSHYGGDYEDGSEGGGARCTKEGCGWRAYVTGICTGKISFDSGKFHNHCVDCKGFGKCMGDYRMAHCGNCGKHYFAGLQGFPCSCQENKYGIGGDDDDDEGGMFW